MAVKLKILAGSENRTQMFRWEAARDDASACVIKQVKFLGNL
jgi:hypothetical protein